MATEVGREWCAPMACSACGRLNKADGARRDARTTMKWSCSRSTAHKWAWVGPVAARLIGRSGVGLRFIGGRASGGGQHPTGRLRTARVTGPTCPARQTMAPRPSALPLTGPSLPFFPKSWYNLENNQQSPRHQRGLVLTNRRGGETTSTNTQPLATWPPCGLFHSSVRQAVLLWNHLGRPANFPSLGAAWIRRWAARWPNDSSRWLCKNAGLGDYT